MTAEIEIPIAYEQLEALEDDFEEVELEILRTQDRLSKDLYAKRDKLASQIPNFWALVIEQAPPEVDEYIMPLDANLLLNSLTRLSVERFELPNGDPRSISIKWEFSENEYFENKVLEKKFWWRNANDGWSGLISEPVDIKWKEGKDLTNGMLDLVKKIQQEEEAGKTEETESKKKFKEQMESQGLDGLSFFAWFGFRGRKITDEEHKEATKKMEERRQLIKDGKKADEMDEDEDEDEDEYEWEIFPTADDLAVCIAEDLWPGAIKYFLAAHDQDGISDIDFEDSDFDMEGGDEDDGNDQPSKKRKA